MLDLDDEPELWTCTDMPTGDGLTMSDPLKGEGRCTARGWFGARWVFLGLVCRSETGTELVSSRCSCELSC